MPLLQPVTSYTISYSHINRQNNRRKILKKNEKKGSNKKMDESLKIRNNFWQPKSVRVYGKKDKNKINIQKELNIIPSSSHLSLSLFLYLSLRLRLPIYTPPITRKKRGS